MVKMEGGRERAREGGGGGERGGGKDEKEMELQI